MDSICLGLKEEVKWVGQQLHLRKMRKIPFLQAHQIKVNYLFVIGLGDLLMKLEARMIRYWGSGINKDVLDLLLHWI